MSQEERIMKLNYSKTATLIGMLCVSAATVAQQPVDAGKQEYQWHCAICHGDSGTGYGEMRKWLTKAPSDLTTISKRNGGTFPNQLVWEIIDGRTSTAIGPHGTREMPVWGQRYHAEVTSGSAPAAAPEWAIRNRIVALLDYLSRIQSK
jgi:mono/diheme cytochrome c family protein